MKNKELVTELAARMGWTAQEVAETLSVLSSVVSSRLVDNGDHRDLHSFPTRRSSDLP